MYCFRPLKEKKRRGVTSSELSVLIAIQLRGKLLDTLKNWLNCSQFVHVCFESIFTSFQAFFHETNVFNVRMSRNFPTGWITVKPKFLFNVLCKLLVIHRPFFPLVFTLFTKEYVWCETINYPIFAPDDVDTLCPNSIFLLSLLLSSTKLSLFLCLSVYLWLFINFFSRCTLEWWL